MGAYEQSSKAGSVSDSSSADAVIRCGVLERPKVAGKRPPPAAGWSAFPDPLLPLDRVSIQWPFPGRVVSFVDGFVRASTSASIARIPASIFAAAEVLAE